MDLRDLPSPEKALTIPLNRRRVDVGDLRLCLRPGLRAPQSIYPPGPPAKEVSLLVGGTLADGTKRLPT